MPNKLEWLKGRVGELKREKEEHHKRIKERNETARLEKEYNELKNPTWTAFKTGFSSTVGRGVKIVAQNIASKSIFSTKHPKKTTKRTKIYDKHGNVYYTSAPKNKKTSTSSRKPSNNLFGMGDLRPSIDWGM